MKKAHEILYNLTHDSPTFKPLRQKTQIHDFILLLPYSLRQAILFTQIKHQTLLFALNHPAFLKEFNYKIPLIKSLLIKAQKEAKFDELVGLSKIAAFVSYRAFQSEREEVREEFCYEEHARANFHNHAQNPKLHAIFEEIRAIIQRHHKMSDLEGEEGFWKRQLL